MQDEFTTEDLDLEEEIDSSQDNGETQEIVADETGIADLGGSMALFEGDTGDMPVAARRVAIALKRQRAIEDEDFRIAKQYLKEVTRSLNNDLLVPVIDEHYEAMYAQPVMPDNYEMRSLKSRSSLSAWAAALLVQLRRKVLEYENVGDSADKWIISLEEMVQAMSTGAGPFAGRNSEEGVTTRVLNLVGTMKNNGFLVQLADEEDMYRITKLVPVVVNMERIAAWTEIVEEEEPNPLEKAQDSEPDLGHEEQTPDSIQEVLL